MENRFKKKRAVRTVNKLHTAYLWKAMEIYKEMCNTEDGKPEELELSCRAKATDEVWV